MNNENDLYRTMAALDSLDTSQLTDNSYFCTITYACHAGCIGHETTYAGIGNIPITGEYELSDFTWTLTRSIGNYAPNCNAVTDVGLVEMIVVSVVSSDNRHGKPPVIDDAVATFRVDR